MWLLSNRTDVETISSLAHDNDLAGVAAQRKKLGKKEMKAAHLYGCHTVENA